MKKLIIAIIIIVYLVSLFYVPCEVRDFMLVHGAALILNYSIIVFIIRRLKLKSIKNEEERNFVKGKSTKSLLIGIVLYMIFKIIGVIAVTQLTSVVLPEPVGVDYKPIIYLYPSEDQNVTVRLKYDKNITVSYPKYDKEWNVYAYTSGELLDLKTNNKLYSLYYEANNNYKFSVKEDGFIVKDEDLINFFEEKLTILGLNYKEKEEFIIYWLPILQENKYNYIRFAETLEIDSNMPLEVEPKPDSIIRILMTYKKVDKPFKVKEQTLKTPSRDGFTVVEWGGTKIK